MRSGFMSGMASEILEYCARYWRMNGSYQARKYRSTCQILMICLLQITCCSKTSLPIMSAIAVDVVVGYSHLILAGMPVCAAIKPYPEVMVFIPVVADGNVPVGVASPSFTWMFCSLFFYSWL